MLFGTGQLIRRAASARNLHRSRRAGELGCCCRHGPANTFCNAFARGAVHEPLANDFFRMAFCYIMRSRRCVRCLHCPAADYCAAACASAKFSKCHPNRHISFPVFYATQSLKVQKIMGRLKRSVTFLHRYICKKLAPSASRLTLIQSVRTPFTTTSHESLWLMSH